MDQATTPFYFDRKYRLLVSITLLLGLTAALIGPVLRYAFIAPVSFDYKNLMHAHSHTMLMGWLFNGFVLAICRKIFCRIPYGVFTGMLIMSLLVVMQLLLFPAHGYDRTTILLLVIYTLASYYVLYEVYRAAGKLDHRRLPGLLIKTAILFYALSTLCLFGLGPLMSGVIHYQGGYDLLIQLYLHFQYNGFFWFVFLALLGSRYGWVNKTSNRAACFLMAAGTVLLSGFLTWKAFGSGSAAGATGALLQLLAACLFWGLNRWSKPGFLLMLITLLAMLKLLLQLGGFSPTITTAVFDSRPLMVAWLHFAFLGIYTPLLWRSLQLAGIPAWLWAGFWIALAFSLGGLVAPHLLYFMNISVLLYIHWWNFLMAVLLYLFLAGITLWLFRSYWINYQNKFYHE